MAVLPDIAAIVAASSEIAGWMDAEELRWLAEQATTRRRIVEIGGYCGRSSKALAMATPGLLTTIDTLVGEPDVPGLEDTLLLNAWLTNLDAEIAVRKARHFTGSAADYIACGLGRQASADMVFVDGAHTYEAVLADCDAALWLCDPGGLIAGHDWYQDDVQRAVLTVFPNAEVVRGALWAVHRDR